MNLRRDAVRRTIEGLMYLAFTAAALPLAWVSVHELLYYRAHPDDLQTRDTAPLALVMSGVDLVMDPALALAAVLALYFLIRGPRPLRYASGALVLGWILMAVTPLSAPFNSVKRLYLDAVPFVALSLLPLVCAFVRVRSRR
jgi:hypothetical protein